MQQGALGLADMPAEIIAHILGRVSSLGDLAACLAASSIFCAAPLDRAAAERTDVGMTKLLAAGAPLWVIRHVVHERAIERVPPHWIQWSAQGGRVDVIEWVCDLACTPSSADHDDNGSNGGDGSEPEIASPPRKKRRLTPDTTNPRVVHEHAIASALSVSVRHARHDALVWLLSLWNTTSFGQARPLVSSLLIEAARTSGTTLGTIAHLHDFPLDADVTGCSSKVGRAAFYADRADILAWVSANRCACGLVLWPNDVATTYLFDAMSDGRAKVARWIVETGIQLQRPFDIHVTDTAVTRAASLGHIESLNLARDMGIDLPLMRMAITAARDGRLDVLRWILDDSALGPGPCARGPGAFKRRLSLSVGHAAAAGGRDDIVRWLADRPDASHALSVGAARLALSKGHFGVARILHEAGIAPFDGWDSLLTAVASGIVDNVRSVSFHVATCDISVFIKALLRTDSKIVAFLCTRYGTAHAQQAIDAVAGRSVQHAPLMWMRDNIPNLCIADAWSHPYGRLPVCRCSGCP